jgi:uncharacterized SAM-binding protein YcdF (DUF218 family)
VPHAAAAARLTRTGAFAALVLAVWLAATAILFLWPSEVEPSRADAVVVLSGVRKARLATGLELVRSGVAPTLVISDGTAPGWEEGNRLCDGASADFRVVCFRPHPYSTHGEAADVARLARARGWRSLVVVTSRYHLTRARLLFRRCFDGPVGAVSADTSPGAMALNVPFEWGKLLTQLTLERDC